MRLKNFHTVIANTSPAIKEKIRIRTDLLERGYINILLGDRVLLERITGQISGSIPDYVDWPEIMKIVEGIEDMGYSVAIYKYSCTVTDTSTNKTVVSNPNQYKIYTKKETVLKACIQFAKYFNTL